MACTSCHKASCSCHRYGINNTSDAVQGDQGQKGPDGDAKEVVLFDGDYTPLGFTPITISTLNPVPQETAFYEWTSSDPAEIESDGDILQLTAYFSMPYGSIAGNKIKVLINNNPIYYDNILQEETFNGGIDQMVITLTLHRHSYISLFVDYHVEYYTQGTATQLNKFFYFPTRAGINTTPFAVNNLETDPIRVKYVLNAISSPVDITLDRLRVEKYNNP